MNLMNRNRIGVILAMVIAAAVIVSAFVHAGEDDFITDPVRLAGRWEAVEVWQNEKQVRHSNPAFSIDIDKNGGFHLWNLDADDELTGRLQEKNGQWYFEGRDGASYAIHGRNRQLIVTIKEENREETLVCEWDGYCADALLTGEERTERYFKLLKEAAAMKDRVSQSLYKGIIGRMSNGCPEGEAATKAKEDCIRDEALVWYAEEHDIFVTDEELEEYMDWIIDSLSNPALSDEAYDTALRNAGMTLEERVRTETEGCRVDCFEDKLRKTQSIEGWDDFEKDIVNRYRHTQAYRDLKVDMDKAVEKIKAGIHQ